MPAFRFAAGLHFRLNGHDCLVEAVLADDALLLKNLTTGAAGCRERAELIDALFSGSLEPWGGAEPFTAPSARSGPCLISELPDFEDDPLRVETLRRIAYVDRALVTGRGHRSERVLKEAIRAVAMETADRRPPSWTTLYRWVRRFEDAGRDVRALVPATRRRGNRTPRVTGTRRECVGAEIRERAAIVDRILDDVVRERYLSSSRPTVAAVYDTLKVRIDEETRVRGALGPLPLPHPSTLYRKVASLDPFAVTAARHGRKVATERYHAVRLGPRPTRPLERVELDHTRVDLMVVDTATRLPLGRPWLTSMLDGYSRMVLGMYLSFQPPSYLSVMQCLRHAVRPKGYIREVYPRIEHDWPAWGLPELLVVDNGKEFHSRHFEDACLQLGVRVDHAPNQCGAYKGAVERWFGTENTRLLHQLPGTTFSDIFERGEYDPARNAIISLDALLELVHVWIVDVYNQEPHRGIKAIPYQRWTAGIDEWPPALPTRGDDLDVLLGCVAERRITRCGVELFVLRYNSSELALVRRDLAHGQKARIKYDPSDLGAIHVFDQTRDRYIRVPALDEDYARGLTLWQHEVIRRYARRRLEGQVDREALRRARQHIEEIVGRERATQNGVARRQRAARYLGLGQPDYSRPAPPTSGDATTEAPPHPVYEIQHAANSHGAGDADHARAGDTELTVEEAGWSVSYDLPRRGGRS